jgi:hypothetical protein
MPAIPNSILDTTKKILGLDADYDAFDIDVITHINSVFAQLNQLGAGPSDGFEIQDSTTLWDEYLGENKKNLAMIKSYMFTKVRLMFDTANASSFFIASLEKQIAEFEWRINVAVDKGDLVSIPIVVEAGDELYYVGSGTPEFLPTPDPTDPETTFFIGVSDA